MGRRKTPAGQMAGTTFMVAQMVIPFLQTFSVCCAPVYAFCLVFPEFFRHVQDISEFFFVNAHPRSHSCDSIFLMLSIIIFYSRCGIDVTSHRHSLLNTKSKSKSLPQQHLQVRNAAVAAGAECNSKELWVRLALEYPRR